MYGSLAGRLDARMTDVEGACLRIMLPRQFQPKDMTVLWEATLGSLFCREL